MAQEVPRGKERSELPGLDPICNPSPALQSTLASPGNVQVPTGGSHMQRRPALVVCLVHSSTLLHQEANDFQVLIYAGLRMGTSPSALISPNQRPNKETFLQRQTQGPKASEGCGKQCRWPPISPRGPPATSHLKYSSDTMLGSAEHGEFMERRAGSGSRERMDMEAMGLPSLHVSAEHS